MIADPPRTEFWLGTSDPTWLWLNWFWLDRDRWKAEAPVDDVPMFISHERLVGYRALERAVRPWALDSGGFSQITRFGKFDDSPAEYVAAIRRYQDEIGGLAWAASQDWMTEDRALRASGLTIAEHHRRTVENYVTLVELLGAQPATAIVKPTLQGPEPDDYARCWDLYDTYGVDLTTVPLVALGSVCRQESTPVLGKIIAAVRRQSPRVRLHGFGVKTHGIRAYGHLMSSMDSMAWSFGARRRKIKDPRCRKYHEVCSSCFIYASTWRDKVLAGLSAPAADPARTPLLGAIRSQ
jgi:hypothetical protein